LENVPTHADDNQNIAQEKPMNFRPALSAITTFCVGLSIATAAMAQERGGLFIPRPGMQFTTAFTNDYGRDAESLTTVTSVTGNAVGIDYSSSRGLSVHRELLVIDRQTATSYVLGYEADMPIVISGTTSLGISTRILSELRSDGRARLTLIYSHKLASIECDLTRVSTGLMLQLIVEDRIADISAMHAKAKCGEGERTAWGDFYFANDLNQPLLIESSINFSWEKRPRTERITRVIDGRGLNPDMEQSLKTIGKYDAYGLRFDFDSAELRPESVQLVREIAQMLQANAEWKIQIAGHTDSTGGPDYNYGLSDKRAEAVRLALVENGVESWRLRSEGRGESQPKADNDTLAGRAINRRVEFRRLDRSAFGSRPLDAK
jgi:outer membrane protein OmpA-like peptidoglycan-associated protein